MSNYDHVVVDDLNLSFFLLPLVAPNISNVAMVIQLRITKKLYLQRNSSPFIKKSKTWRCLNPASMLSSKVARMKWSSTAEHDTSTSILFKYRNQHAKKWNYFFMTIIFNSIHTYLLFGIKPLFSETEKWKCLDRKAPLPIYEEFNPIKN